MEPIDFRMLIHDWIPDRQDALSGDFSITVICEVSELSDTIRSRLIWDDVRPLLAKLRGKQINGIELENLRKSLGSILFGDQRLLICLAKVNAVAKQRDTITRIRLDIIDNRLTTIPWEIAYISDSNTFMGIDPDFSIVRHIRSNELHSVNNRRGAIRILIAVSDNVEGYDDLSCNEHINELTENIHKVYSEKNINIFVENLVNPNYDEFLGTLNDFEGWDIIHYIGHGTIISGDSSLVFRKKDSIKPDTISLKKLASSIKASGVSIVNLCACHSGQSTINAIPNGIAGGLARIGIPSIISMQDMVRPEYAFIQNMEIYKQLAYGANIDQAIIYSRIAMMNHLQENIEWSIPILHLRTNANLKIIDNKEYERYLRNEIQLEINKINLTNSSSLLRLRDIDNKPTSRVSAKIKRIDAKDDSSILDL